MLSGRQLGIAHEKSKASTPSLSVSSDNYLPTQPSQPSQPLDLSGLIVRMQHYYWLWGQAYGTYGAHNVHNDHQHICVINSARRCARLWPRE